MFVSSFFVICLICFCESHALSFEERLMKFERTLEHQAVKLQHQEKIIRDQEKTIKTQEKENNDLKLRLSILEEEIRKLKITVNDKEIISGHADNQRGYSLGNSGLEGVREVEDIQIDSSKLSRTVKRQSNGIAFHAYLTGSKCIQQGQLVVFDTESIDEGNGYSPSEGIYVVPETGTYVFMWTYFSSFNEWSTSDLIVDGERVGWIATDDETDQATGVAVVQLNLGKHVFIRRGKGNGCTENDNFCRSTFTGWKLF